MKKYSLFLFIIIFCANLTYAQQDKPLDRILKNGFWIDFGAGFSHIHKNQKPWKHHYSFSFNLGNKWYQPEGMRTQLGLQMTWIGGGLDLGEGGYINIGAIGVCGLFRINKKAGIETNLNIGPAVHIDGDYGYAGGQVNLGIQYRVGYFTIGTTFRYSLTLFSPYSNSDVVETVNLMMSLGCKF